MLLLILYIFYCNNIRALISNLSKITIKIYNKFYLCRLYTCEFVDKVETKSELCDKEPMEIIRQDENFSKLIISFW